MLSPHVVLGSGTLKASAKTSPSSPAAPVMPAVHAGGVIKKGTEGIATQSQAGSYTVRFKVNTTRRPVGCADPSTPIVLTLLCSPPVSANETDGHMS